MVDFPRGDKSSIVPIEPVKAEKKRKTSETKSVVKKAKRSVEGPRCDLESKPAELIYFKHMRVGVRCLCVIKEIRSGEMLLTLPNGLRAFVDARNVNRVVREVMDLEEEAEGVVEVEYDLHDFFRVGQIVRGVVVGVENGGKKRIEMSLDPSVVQKDCEMRVGSACGGVVVSEEDHGYMCEIGNEKIGFLKKGEQRYKLGEIVDVVIESENARTVQLSDEKFRENVMKRVEEFKWLNVGQRVECVVEKVTEVNVQVKICGMIKGYVNYFHFGKEQVKEKQKIVGRILYVDFENKRVQISLNKGVNEWRVEMKEEEVGMKQKWKIERIDGGEGLMVKFEDKVGFVKMNNLSEENSLERFKKFRIGEEVKGRIINYEEMDEMYQVSFKKSDLEQEYLRMKDVKVGSVIKGKVTSITEQGVLVSISDKIKGFCPKIQFGDVLIKKNKFKQDKEYKFVVLSVDLEMKRIVLSHKKMLMSSEYEKIITIEDAKVGMITNGTITNICEFGVFVSFYNNLSALIPNNELSFQKVKAEEIVQIGQTVTCRIISNKNNKLAASLKLNENKRDVKIGQLFKTKIKEKEKNHLICEISDSIFRLDLNQISDFESENSEIFKKMKKGQEIEVLVVEKDRVSMKPILIKNENKSMKIGSLVYGYVKKITEFGCFVSFVYKNENKIGLILKNEISDLFVNKIEDYLRVDQTVNVLIKEIDQDKIYLSCKKSLIKKNLEKEFLSELLESVKESYKESIKESVKESESNSTSNNTTSTSSSNTPLVGDVVRARLKQKLNAGNIMECDNGFTGFIMNDGIYNGKEFKDYRILDINYKERILDLTRINVTNTLQITKKEEKAEIVLIKKNYLIGIIKSLNNQIVFIGIQSFNNQINPFNFYSIGQVVSINNFHVLNNRLVSYISKNKSMNNLINKSINKSDLVGKEINVRIKKILSNQINVHKVESSRIESSKSDKVCRIYITEIKPLKVGQVLNLRKMFKVDEILKVKVIDEDNKTIECSLKDIIEDVVEEGVDSVEDSEESDNPSNAPSNACSVGVVVKEEKKKVWIALDRSNLISMSKLDYLCSGAQIGSVLNINIIDNQAYPLEINKQFCLVNKINEFGLNVSLPNKQFGIVHITDIDSSVEFPLTKYSIGDIIPCEYNANANANDKDKDKDKIYVSILSKVVEGDSKDIIEEKVLNSSFFKNKQSIESLNGSLVVGYVKSLNDHAGLFISITKDLTARVLIKNLSDSFLVDWKSEFKIGQRVLARIISTENGLECSLKKSIINPNQTISLDSLEINQSIFSIVTKITEFGLFLNILDSSISGLCHVSRVPAFDLSKFKVGQKVSPKIVSIDKDKKRINFSLLDDDSDVQVESLQLDNQQINEECDENRMEISEMDFGNFVNQQEETNEETILDYQFNWDVNENKNDSDSDDEEEIVNKKEKINKNERSIEMLEKRLLQENDPETLDDFERLVASNPNDSFTWVRYMAFHLKLSEIDKARNVAEKALKSISFRNEQEKFNVWMALINLENKFGSEISLNQTIERSLQFNEPKKVYLQLAKIYESTNKTIEATNLWQSVILKKFSHSCKAFVEAANFFVRINKIEIARSLLNKALKSLDKRKHVKVVNKFAQLEYKFGDVERARTLFEGLLANYPKRLDLWSIYIDMEIKLVKQSKESFKSVAATLAIESVRRLFERVLSLKFSVKKKKFLFKKYLDFENVYGNEESVNHVKQLAIDYVNQL